MGRYSEDDIFRETYGGQPKGWSSKMHSEAPTDQKWEKAESVTSQVDDAQFQVGLGAPRAHPPQPAQSESLPTEQE